MFLKIIRNFLKEIYKEKQEDRFLKEVDFLKHLNNDELKSFSKIFLTRKFSAGEVIFRENYPHVVLYIVKSGEVEIFLEKQTTGIILSKIGRARHFGEVGLFTEANRSASAKAITDTVLYAITKNQFKRYLLKNPATGIKLIYHLGESMAKSLISANERLKKHEIS